MPLEFPSLGSEGLLQTSEEDIRAFIKELLRERPGITPVEISNLVKNQFPDAEQDVDRLVSGAGLQASFQPTEGVTVDENIDVSPPPKKPGGTTQEPVTSKLPPLIEKAAPSAEKATPWSNLPPGVSEFYTGATPVPPTPYKAVPRKDPWSQSYGEWRQEVGLPPDPDPVLPEISKIPYAKGAAFDITDLTTAEEYAKYYGMARPFDMDGFYRMADAFIPPYELTSEQHNILQARVPINQWNAEAAFWAGVPQDVIDRAIQMGGVNVATAGWNASTAGGGSNFWNLVEDAFNQPEEESPVAERLRVLGIDPSSLGDLFQRDYEARLQAGLVGEGGVHTPLSSSLGEVVEEDGTYYRVSPEGIKVPLMPTDLEGIANIGETLITPLVLPEGVTADKEGNLTFPDGSVYTTRDTYITPPKTYVDEMGATITEPGKEYTAEEIADSKTLITALGNLFPTEDVDQLLAYAELNQSKFLDMFHQIGDSPIARAVLKMVYPTLTDDELAQIFNPSPISPTSYAVNPLAPTQLDAAIQNFLEVNSRKTDLSTEEGRQKYGRDGIEWLKGGVGVMGAFIEKFVGRPWELAGLYLSDELYKAIARRSFEGQGKFKMEVREIPTGYDQESEANKILIGAAQKYGWAMVFSDEVSEAWETAWGESQKVWSGAKYFKTAYEFANPIYLIPIGETLGLAAKITSKIPVIGEALRYTAAGVQAVERGVMYPVTKPVELVIKGGLKAVEKASAGMTQKIVNRMIEQSKSLEHPMNLASMDEDIASVLVDNWQKRLLTTLAKAPPLKKGIEAVLGWKVLISRTAQDVQNKVARGAIGWSVMTRRGINAAAVKEWELTALINDPVKYYGFDKTAFSEFMYKKLRPKFRKMPDVLKEAGTIEHVFTQPDMYNWAGILEGRKYIALYQEVEDEMLALLIKEGVPPEAVIEEWIHRMVVDVKKMKGSPRLKRGSKAIGKTPTYEMPRRFKTMGDARRYFLEHPELNKAYANNPVLLIKDYITQAYQRIADARFIKYTEEFGTPVSEIFQQMFPREAAAWQLRPMAERVAKGVGVEVAPKRVVAATKGMKALEALTPEISAASRAMAAAELKAGTPVKNVIKLISAAMPEDAAKTMVDQIKKGWGKVGYAERRVAPRIGGTVPQVSVREHMADLGYIVAQTKKAFNTLRANPKFSGEILPYSTIRSIENRAPKLAAELKNILGMKGNARTLALTKFQKNIYKELQVLKPKWDAAKAAYAKGMEVARKPEIGMDYLPQPFAGGKQYEDEFVDVFKKYFKVEQGSTLLKITAEASGMLRIATASLDLSAACVQGLPSLGLAFAHCFQNPTEGAKMMGIWFKSFGDSVGVYFNPQIAAKAIAKNAESVAQRANRGGSVLVSDYIISTESTIAAKMGRFTPYQRANLSFCIMTEEVRDGFWKIMQPRCKNIGQEYELAKILDNITGVFSSEAAGVPMTIRQLENSLVFFAPNYTRACLATVSHLFRGGYTGAEARKAIGGMLALGALFMSGIKYSKALIEGKTEEQARDDVLANFGVFVDPITGEVSWKPGADFMSLKIGNSYIGARTFWFKFMRLASAINYSLEKLGEAAENDRLDLLTILKGGGDSWLDNPLIKTWYSGSAPVVGLGFELASGRDYFGYPISPEGKSPIEDPASYAAYIMTRFEPFWGDDVINPYIPQLSHGRATPEGATRVAVAAASVLGLSAFPESSSAAFYDAESKVANKLPVDVLERFYTPDELPKILQAQAEGKLRHDMLPSGLQDMLISETLYPELAKLWEVASTDRTIRDSLVWKQWEEQWKADQKIFYDACNALNAQVKSGEKTTRDLRLESSHDGEMYGTSQAEMERTPAYTTIYDFLTEREKTVGKYDWFYDRAVRKYTSIITQEYLDKNGDPDYETRRKAIDQFKADYGSQLYDQIKKTIAQKQLDAGQSPAMVSKSQDVEKLQPYFDLKDSYGDPDRKAREAFLKDPKNVEIAALLVFWGYVSTFKNPDAEPLVRQMMTKYSYPESAIPAFAQEILPKKAADAYGLTQADWAEWRAVGKQNKRDDQIEYDQWQYLLKHPDMNKYLNVETGRADARTVHKNLPPSDKFVEAWDNHYDKMRKPDGKADAAARYAFRGNNCWFDKEGVASGKFTTPHPNCALPAKKPVKLK